MHTNPQDLTIICTFCSNVCDIVCGEIEIYILISYEIYLFRSLGKETRNMDSLVFESAFVTISLLYVLCREDKFQFNNKIRREIQQTYLSEFDENSNFVIADEYTTMYALN